ncbi:MAG: hypothetical protein Q8M29_17620 [Bacteroidota bacterium]|nr:hypothetical protein [Bacteroidota bacterium]
MNLTNKAIVQLFTVPELTWVRINSRVGFILHLASPSNTSGFDMNAYQYEASLSNSCEEWSATTYNSIINLATQIQNYANNAVSSFSGLNQQISNSGGVISPALQEVTTSTLNSLARSTNELVTSCNPVSQSMLTFLSTNKTFDSYVLTLPIPDIVPILGMPAIDPTIEGVVGDWITIVKALSAPNCTPSEVDRAFLESLNIQVAINQWTEISTITQAFINYAGGLNQYFTYPPGN